MTLSDEPADPIGLELLFKFEFRENDERKNKKVDCLEAHGARENPIKCNDATIGFVFPRIMQMTLHRLAPALGLCHFHRNFFKFGFLRSEKKSARAQNDVIARSTTMETSEANSKAHLARMCSNCSFYDRLCRM